MRAILRSYGCDGRYCDELVQVDDDHDFGADQYAAETIPFPVGSNQAVLPLEDVGLMEIQPRNPVGRKFFRTGVTFATLSDYDFKQLGIEDICREVADNNCAAVDVFIVSEEISHQEVVSDLMEADYAPDYFDQDDDDLPEQIPAPEVRQVGDVFVTPAGGAFRVYSNSPATILHDGLLHKGYLAHSDDNRTALVWLTEKPEGHVDWILL